MPTVLVTGSSGLVGSEAVTFFDGLGWHVHGIDNNMRRTFFGPDGDTTWNLERLLATARNFSHHEIDIRDKQTILRLFETLKLDLVVHCAAQPSHDLAREMPFEDFEVNAVATYCLLEATRRHCPEAVFVFMSTNKVYGDAPNELPLVELPTRWDYARDEDRHGVSESCRIDQSLHSLFGASKVAADILTQEYGRYFGMKTVCFRGGCLTGPRHSGALMHGFLSYLARAVKTGKKYTIFGYQGKQVRDQIHSRDVCRAMYEFYQNPRPGEVYNLGGGRENSVSLLEAIEALESLAGQKLETEYTDEHRKGDHICYISDLRKLRSHYPNWSITKGLPEILEEIHKEGPQSS